MPSSFLLEDFAENGSWWTGGQDDLSTARARSHGSGDSQPAAASRALRIDWPGLDSWYAAVINAGEHWRNVYDEMVLAEPSLVLPDERLREAGAQILSAQDHIQRGAFEVSETLLKRPGSPCRRGQRFTLSDGDLGKPPTARTLSPEPRGPTRSQLQK